MFDPRMLAGQQAPVQEGQPTQPEGEEGQKKTEVPKPGKPMATDLDKDALNHMLMSGDSSEGNLTFEDDKPKPNPDEKPEYEAKDGKIIRKLGKYEKELFESIRKNPEKYTVKTPKGDMNLKEAMSKGFNPKKGTFDGRDFKKEEEDILAKAPESDRNRIQSMTNPENAQFPEAEAERFGIDKKNPMVKKPMQQGETQAVDPLAAMLGGGM